jgi:inhibitor of cysteine peptidase
VTKTYRINIARLFSLAILPLLLSCASNKVLTYPDTTNDKNFVRLNVDDDGRQVEMNKGQYLEISLTANPSTGFSWEAAEYDHNLFGQLDSEFRPRATKIGTDGMTVFLFEATNSGSTPVKLIYHRQWEKTTPPARTFTVNVTIR